MSQLVHLQDKLQNVGATMARLEMEIARHPESAGLVANFRSMQKLHSSLQHDFDHAANDLGLDVTHYRLTESRPTARALTRSVGTFQDAIAVAYDALTSGPKSRRYLSQAIQAETALEVAYSYPGSFGVVFTIPNQRLLIPDMQSRLDRAIETVLQLGKARDSKQVIVDTEAKLGKATVSAVYEWAKANTQYKLGTAIEWKRDSQVRAEVMIQAPEFAALSESLEKIGVHDERTITPSGTLVGADIKSHVFHFVTIDDQDIRGRFADAISEKQAAQLPGRYTAIIRKTTDTTYATEEEKVTYFLEHLV